MGLENSNCCNSDTTVNGEMMLELKVPVDWPRKWWTPKNRINLQNLTMQLILILFSLSKNKKCLGEWKFNNLISFLKSKKLFPPKVTSVWQRRLEHTDQLWKRSFSRGFLSVSEDWYHLLRGVESIFFNIKNDAPNGYGTNYYPNGNYFEGTFVEGTPHGYGRLINSQGHYFEGEVKFGRANGSGVYDNKFVSYRGDFKDNQKHGKGVEKSHDGVYFFDGNF